MSDLPRLSGCRCRPRPLAVVGLILGALLWAPPAAAQSADDTNSRLSRLEAQIQSLQRQIGRGSTASGEALAPTQAADFEIRLSQLERTVQDMVGKYEEAVFGVSQVRDRLDKLSADLDFRLSQIESKGGASAAPGAAATPRPTATVPTAARPADKPADKPGEKPGEKPEAPAAASGTLGGVPANIQEQYDEAFGLLRKADYEQAERALTVFVNQHRDSPLAGNAQYWLGETYYVRGKYADAAVAFADGVKKYPKNNKAPDNLLKLGMALAALNQKSDACKTFDQFGTVYPNAAASLKRRAEIERKKLSCS